MTTLPILINSNPDTPIFYYKDEIITHEEFIKNVAVLARSMKKHKYAINLCEDRYLFALAFAACMMQQQISLMPASRAEKEIEALEQDYQDTHRIDDELIKTLLSSSAITKEVSLSKIDTKQLVAIVFTSGSSGKPKANPKQWGALVDSAQRVASQLRLNQPSQHTLIATVPPQHMYGFETTIIFPLVTGVCVHSSKPFFPDDIRQTITAVNDPVILVTTPIHLRACTQTNLEWPAIDFALSATAPLSIQLAHDAEKELHTSVREIYGCSEAGVIATRNTTQNLEWTLLEDYSFSEKLTGVCLLTPLSDEEILLPDQVEQIDSRHFNLLGRQSDLVKIAGKRGSLNDLKIKLCELDGVDDAIFFMPDEHPDEKARIAAFVVAPELSIKKINTMFSHLVDNAFVPRPLIKVDKLPYNETGKLPRKNLVTLFKRYRNNKQLKDSA